MSDSNKHVKKKHPVVSSHKVPVHYYIISTMTHFHSTEMKTFSTLLKYLSVCVCVCVHQTNELEFTEFSKAAFC